MVTRLLAEVPSSAQVRRAPGVGVKLKWLEAPNILASTRLNLRSGEVPESLGAPDTFFPTIPGQQCYVVNPKIADAKMSGGFKHFGVRRSLFKWRCKRLFQNSGMLRHSTVPANVRTLEEFKTLRGLIVAGTWNRRNNSKNNGSISPRRIPAPASLPGVYPASGGNGMLFLSLRTF